jgi:hypothetical protein
MSHGQSSEPHYNPYQEEPKQMTPEEQRRLQEAMAAGAAGGCVACCFMIPFLALIILIPLWGVWMWVPGFWQKSQAHNQELLDWGHLALVALFSHIFLNPLFQLIIKGMCFSLKEGQPMTTEMQSKHDWIDSIETWIRLGVEFWMAYLAFTGAAELSDMLKSGSAWFDFSMICMDVIMWFYFLWAFIFVASMILVCSGVMAQHEHGWKGMENKMYGRKTSKPQGNYQQLNEGHQLQTGH